MLGTSLLGCLTALVVSIRTVPSTYFAEVERLEPETGEVVTWAEWKGVESIVRMWEGYSEMVELMREDRKRKPGARVVRWGGSGVCVRESYSSVLLLHDLFKGVVMGGSQFSGELVRGIRSEKHELGSQECNRYIPIGFNCQYIIVNIKASSADPIRAEIRGSNTLTTPPTDFHYIYHITSFSSESFLTEHTIRDCIELDPPTLPYLNEYHALIEWVTDSRGTARYIEEASSGTIRSRDADVHTLSVIGEGVTYYKDGMLHDLYKSSEAGCEEVSNEIPFPLRDLVGYFEGNVIRDGGYYYWAYIGTGLDMAMVTSVPTTEKDSTVLNITITLKDPSAKVTMWGVPTTAAYHILTPVYIDPEPLAKAETVIPRACPAPAHNLTSRISRSCFKTCCAAQGWDQQQQPNCFSSASYVAYVACALVSGAALAFLLIYVCKKK